MYVPLDGIHLLMRYYTFTEIIFTNKFQYPAPGIQCEPAESSPHPHILFLSATV
jgi:hypothetical protein